MLEKLRKNGGGSVFKGYPFPEDIMLKHIDAGLRKIDASIEKERLKNENKKSSITKRSFIHNLSHNHMKSKQI